MELDLIDCSAIEATAMAVESVGDQATDEWWSASCWLRHVERKADDAAVQGALALAAANAEEWPEALHHAEQAWLLECESGRPLTPESRPSWQQLHKAIAAMNRPVAPQRQMSAAETPIGVKRELTAIKAEMDRLTHRVEELACLEAAAPVEMYVEQYV